MTLVNYFLSLLFFKIIWYAGNKLMWKDNIIGTVYKEIKGLFHKPIKFTNSNETTMLRVIFLEAFPR